MLVHELRGIGADASIAVDEPPVPRAGCVDVFLPPHEHLALSGFPLPAKLLDRSIVISAEQPDSTFFEGNLKVARAAGAVFDINPRAVRAYRAEGIAAATLEPGHTELWDTFDAPGARDIDILFLGRLTDRRSAALASYADIFERFSCHLGLSDNSRPNTRDAAGFAAGENKRALLARSKVLLNIHGEEEPYFEWLRMAEGICAGCAIVSEHSTDVAPLEPMVHLALGRVESLGSLSPGSPRTPNAANGCARVLTGCSSSSGRCRPSRASCWTRRAGSTNEGWIAAPRSPFGTTTHGSAPRGGRPYRGSSR